MALFNDLRRLGDPVPDKAILENVQGNILRGAGTLRTVLLFVRFPDRPEDARRWVRECLYDGQGCFPVSTVASATQTWAVNFLLSAPGLRKLGVSPEVVTSMNPAFVRGTRAKETIDKLSDPAVTDWTQDYQQPWDALLLVGCKPDEESAITTRMNAFVGNLPHKFEYGNALDRNGGPLAADTDDGARYEVFGYRDNASTVVFSSEHADSRGIVGGPRWNPTTRSFEERSGIAALAYDPRREVSLVLTPDLLPRGGFGSYFVYRKLSQDVAGFEGLVENTTRDLETRGRKLAELYGGKDVDAYGLFAGAKPPDVEAIKQLVKTRIMGRSPEGVPAVADELIADHAFNYDGDRGGGRCPFGAHVRSVNPRGQTGSTAFERKKVIARRGIPYGTRGSSERGLLFLCAQQDISDQFEFIQREWANAATHPANLEPAAMPDNVVGVRQPNLDHEPTVTAYGRSRYERFVATIEADFAIQKYVTLVGAEYLFAPSLSGLEALIKGGTP
jgi:deferrochelatase/peroxidase EfeB